jgi:hypothetical protein
MTSCVAAAAAMSMIKLAVRDDAIVGGSKCSLHSWIACRKKAYKWNQQQAGIKPLGAVGLHKAVKIAVETALADFSMDFVGNLAPPLP